MAYGARVRRCRARLYDIGNSAGFPTLGIWRFCFRFTRSMCVATGAIFFAPNVLVGLLLLTAISLHTERLGFAVLGAAIAEAIGLGLGVRPQEPADEALKANAVLAAIAVAWLSAGAGAPWYVALSVAVLCSTGSSLITAALLAAAQRTRLPAMVWGYSLTAGMAFLLVPGWTATAVRQAPIWLPPVAAFGWILDFVRTLGSLLFSSTLIGGTIVAVALLVWSPLSFLMGSLGWASGAITAGYIQTAGVHYYWLPVSYNFFIAGMALGAVFLLPGAGGIMAAVAAGVFTSACAAAIQRLFAYSAFTFLPVSAGVTIWIAIGALRLTGRSHLFRLNHVSTKPPEQAWQRVSYACKRFGYLEPLLIVPVGGPTQIAQGFGGSLSHLGQFRYGLDFVPEAEASNRDSGSVSEGAAVVAPASGYVVRCRDGIPDNPEGICNYAEPWGNYVIIRLDHGGWAVLAHLRKGSIVVGAGMRVETGAYLGVLGNSGRSPSPHLHLQVQTTPEIGSPTVPFRLADFLSATGPDGTYCQWRAAAEPVEGMRVAPAPSVPHTHAVLASICPGSATWSLQTQGSLPSWLRGRVGAGTVFLETRLDQDGSFGLHEPGAGTLICRLDPDGWRIVGSENLGSLLLKLLALAIPSIPYSAVPGLSWSDWALAPSCSSLDRSVVMSRPFLLRKTFLETHLTCGSATQPGQAIEIESSIEKGKASLPRKASCRFHMLKGPDHLNVEFEQGELTFSTNSFTPGSPSAYHSPS